MCYALHFSKYECTQNVKRMRVLSQSIVCHIFGRIRTYKSSRCDVCMCTTDVTRFIHPEKGVCGGDSAFGLEESSFYNNPFLHLHIEHLAMYYILTRLSTYSATKLSATRASSWQLVFLRKQQRHVLPTLFTIARHLKISP